MKNCYELQMVRYTLHIYEAKMDSTCSTCGKKEA